MHKCEATERYYLNVVQRLRAMKFSVVSNIHYGDYAFAHAGTKAKFEIEKFGFAETVFTLSEFDSVDDSTIWGYSMASFAYALRGRRIRLPWFAFGHNAYCYSVAVAYGVDCTTANMVRSVQPPRHWRGCEIPVICDLDTAQLHYFEKTPDWGVFWGFDTASLFWDQFRDTILRVLSP